MVKLMDLLLQLFSIISVIDVVFRFDKEVTSVCFCLIEVLQVTGFENTLARKIFKHTETKDRDQNFLISGQFS